MKSKVLLRVCSAGLYQNAYIKFFNDNNLASLSYEDALQAFRNQGFLYPSGFRRHMEGFGYEVHEVVADFKPLQELWARSQRKEGMSSGENQLLDIFLEQIAVWRPDILYFQELDAVPHYIRTTLKQRFSHIQIITGFKGFPPHVFTDYQDFDFLFIPYPAYIPQWNAAGMQTHYLPHCFDPGDANWLRFQLVKPVKSHDFVFVGSSGYGNANQKYRYELLRTLLAKTPLEVWGLEQYRNRYKDMLRTFLLESIKYFPAQMLRIFRKNTAVIPMLSLLIRDAALVKEGAISANEWFVDNEPLQKLFPHRYHNPVFGSEYLEVMSDAKIVLNIHTDKQGEVGNIRTFESTGSGACLLVDARSGIENLFTPGKEIVTYTSDKECLDTSQKLLSNPDLAQDIAERAQVRTLREHTSLERCRVIHGVLSS